MTVEDIKICKSDDLRREYYNLREYLKFEYVRAFFPTVMFFVAIALTGQIPHSDSEMVRWISLLWPYLTTFTAFICAFGIVYFGGRAWRQTKVAQAIHRELLKRSAQ